MDLNGTLWNSRSGGHKKLVLLMICLVLLVPSLVILLIGSINERKSLMLIMAIIMGVVLLITLVVLAVGKFTKLKWNVSNLIFAVDQSGFYFTGTVDQSSYFFAEWSEIAGYLCVPGKNGKATVTVFFTSPAECGSFGSSHFIDMVNISEVEKLKEAFAACGVNELPHK